MTETIGKRPLKVFLCHAHSDKDAVKALYSRLTKDGVDAWLDKEKLLPGQDWELEIRKAVREADVVIVCLSKQFNQAGFRQKEVRWALDTAMEQPEGEIFIIPVRLDECDTLESLSRWHWVDLFDNYGYEKLMESLNVRSTQLDSVIEKHPSSKNKSIEFLSFVNGGEQIISCDFDGNVTLRETNELTSVVKIAEYTSSFAISPDGGKAIYIRDSQVIVYDLKERDVFVTLKVKDDIISVGSDHVGKYLVAGCSDGSLILLDLGGKRQLFGGYVGKQFGRAEGVNKVEFSHDDKYIISLSIVGNRIKIWDVSTLNFIKEIWGHDEVEDFAQSHDGKYLIWVDVEDDVNYNSTLKVCSFPDLAMVKSFYDSYLLHSLHLTEDGKCIIATTHGGIVKMFDIDNKSQSGKSILDIDKRIRATALSPDGKKIAFGDADGKIELLKI